MTTQDWFVFCFALVILSSITSSILALWWKKLVNDFGFGVAIIMTGIFFVEFLVLYGLYQLLQAG